MGIIVMLAVSVVAFRRARMAGRSVVFWVMGVWIVGLAVGLPVAAIGGIVEVLAYGEPPVMPPFWAAVGMAVGNIAGSSVAAWAAGRPISN